MIELNSSVASMKECSVSGDPSYIGMRVVPNLMSTLTIFAVLIFSFNFRVNFNAYTITGKLILC